MALLSMRNYKDKQLGPETVEGSELNGRLVLRLKDGYWMRGTADDVPAE
jgi:hypothetical protein